MKGTRTEVWTVNEVGAATRTPLYCCPRLRWVAPDKAWSPITTHLCRQPTHLRDLLAEWEHFQTLDDAALHRHGLPTISSLQQFVPSGDSFWSGRVVPTIAKAARVIACRLERALLSSDPALKQTKKLLTDLVEHRILISDDQLLRRCSNTSYQDVRAVRIGSFGLIYGGRTSGPPHLHLQSYLNHFRENGRTLNVIVTSLEDLKDSERNSLLDLKQQYRCDITYLDSHSRHDIAQNLIKYGVSPDRANFALFGLGRKGCNLGALKNALLLKCASQGLMVCDSSTVCAPWWYPRADHRPMLRVTRREPEAYHLFVPDDRPSHVCRSSDLIAAHERGLGKPVSQVVAEFDAKGHVVFESVCEHLLLGLWHGAGQVVATTNGTVSTLDHISPELARSVLKEDNRSLHERLAGKLWRGQLLLNSVDSYTLGHGSWIGNHSVSLDTASNLPPFMPVGQSDEEMFFLTLFNCFPFSYVLSVPCGLPTKEKASDQSVGHCEQSPKLRDLLIACITSSKWRGENDDLSTAIGEGLQILARLPAQEFREQVRLAVKERFELDASRWQYPLSVRRRHPSLSRIVDVFTDNRNEIIKAPQQLFNVSDVAVGSGMDEKATVVQEIFMRFGDLLKSWIDILEIGDRIYSPHCEVSNTKRWTC